MRREFLVVAVLVVSLVIVSALLSEKTETKIESPGSNGGSSGGSETIQPNGTNGATGLSATPAAENSFSVIKVPAVFEAGNGVVTLLRVDSSAGEGKTLVDINQLLFWVDTQYSIQTAKLVAGNYTKIDLSKIDLLYSIDTEASLIEGPSAGAALTIATIAAIRNTTLNPNVMITGTIEPDGSIGEVGGIIEKAKAAKDIGATLFIVPVGQSTETYYQQNRTCRPIGPMTYCTTNYVPVTVDVEQQTNITIKEAVNIEEALKYFI